MNQHHHAERPAPTSTTPAELLDDVQAQIGELLTTIAGLLPLVVRLNDSRQVGLSFVTPAGREAQNRAHHAERTAVAQRLLASKIATWSPGVDIVDVGPGASPTPGNISALSVGADVTFTLHHHARFLIGLQARAGVCTLVRIPADATAQQLLAALRQLVWQTTSAAHLEAVRRDLEVVHGEIVKLIDGPARVPYPTVACPHCGRPSLVGLFERGVLEAVTCDEDQKTGDRHPCTCPDPLCECKARPVEYRHTWYRTRGNKPDGLLTLTGRIEHNRISNDTEGTHP